MLDDPITIHVQKYSDAGISLTAYEAASSCFDGKLEYIDESKFPTNVK